MICVQAQLPHGRAEADRLLGLVDGRLLDAPTPDTRQREQQGQDDARRNEWLHEAGAPERQPASCQDADAEVRAAALTALGETIALDDLSVLISRVVSSKQGADTEVATKALKAASIRMADREACATKLIDASASADVAAKCAVLEILGAMGGPTALSALGNAAKEKTPELPDTATRLLGEWMDVDAAPVLLDLAENLTDNKYKVRAMRGYIRLVRQFTIADAERAEMCRMALETAERDDERKLVLEVLARYPSVATLRLAVQVGENPTLKADAQAASLAIAQKIAGSDDVLKLLEQIGHEPVKIEIVKAEYGADAKQKDVTKILQQHVRAMLQRCDRMRRMELVRRADRHDVQFFRLGAFGNNLLPRHRWLQGGHPATAPSQLEGIAPLPCPDIQYAGVGRNAVGILGHQRRGVTAE